MKRLLTTSIAAVAATLAFASAAGAEDLDVAPGLWEITSTINLGAVSLPKEADDHLTADQREKLAGVLRSLASAGSQTTTHKTCVTADDIKKGAFAGDTEETASCKRTIVSQSKSKQEVSFSCPESRSGFVRVTATGRTAVTGDIEATSREGNLKVALTGKWLGTSCKGAENVE